MNLAFGIMAGLLTLSGAQLAPSLSADQATAGPAPCRKLPNGAFTGEAWREGFQSSPATTDDLHEQAFASQAKFPPAILERIRPRHLAGTFRFRIPLTAEGSQVRLRLSNETGEKPLTINSVSIAIAGPSFAAAGAISPVTFGGERAVTIPAGAPVLSDPVSLSVKDGSVLAVSFNPQGELILLGMGGEAMALASGDQTMAEQLNGASITSGRPLVTGVSVLAACSVKTIVALGDSITDGNRADLGALHSWPEQLARRLKDRSTADTYSVVNAGIGGNRLLQPGLTPIFGVSALARLDRDVLRIDGLSHVVLLEGTNDIGMSGDNAVFGPMPTISDRDVTNAYRQIIQRVHARGAKVIIGTITPFGGSGHSSPTKEKLRQRVNDWIRHSGIPDGVIDFDAAIRDHADPTRIKAVFDSGDHLHPNEAGSIAMGNAVNLSIFN